MYGPSGHTIIVNTLFINSTLNDNSWATIRAASDAGIAQNYWNVGDIKYITLNGQVGAGTVFNNVSVGLVIYGFNHNSAVEGSGITFGGFRYEYKDIALTDSNYNTEVTGKYFSMNHTHGVNWGGWKACDARYDILGSTDIPPQNYNTTKSQRVTGYDASNTCATNPVSNTLMAALPADLRAVMKPITKYTDNTGGTSARPIECVTASIDYLPLPNLYELYSTSYDLSSICNTNEAHFSATYQYYLNGNSVLRYRYNFMSAEALVFTRSPATFTAQNFAMSFKDGNGGWRSALSTKSFGMSPVLLV